MINRLKSESGAVEMTSGSAHILVLPFPAQGHILPLLDLLQHLCFGFDLRFTIIVTPGNASLFAPLQLSHPSKIDTLILPLPSHPSLPPGLENIRDLGSSGILAMVAAFKQLCPLISQWFLSHSDPPVALIYDFFYGWIKSLANELAIPRFVYYSNGAFSSSVIEYCWSHEYIRELEATQMNHLPGSPFFKHHELPLSFRLYVKNNPDCEILKDSFMSNPDAYGCIINTFEDIEGKHVRHLMQERGHDRVFSVGSLSVQGSNEESDSTSKMSWVFDWLDGCPTDSVIYVCFGSQKFMSEEQMKGIAEGLEQSGRRFVWVVKSPPRNGRVPDGFEERVRGRGIMVKEWAPQKRILGHRAVGGFVTHCGWNSTMEGMHCGVRFLTWPMEAEQFQNAWLLENDLGIGVRVCQGSDSVPDPQLFGSVLRLWDADSEDASAARKKAADVKEKAEAAMAQGGSAAKNTERLAIQFCQLAAHSA